MAFIVPKMRKKYKKDYGIILKHIILSYLNFLELRKFLKSGPTKPLLFFVFFGIPPPTKLVSPSVFKEFFGDGILVF